MTNKQNKKYSKHYYNEGQRIYSKLGGGMAYSLCKVDEPLEALHGNLKELPDSLLTMMYRNFECVGMLADNVTYSPDNFDIYVNSLSNLNVNETDLYFYHSDHLGSSSFITDATGISTQHLQYLPFGELFVEQRDYNANYFTPYKFSAKEKDEETGYGYFGARYLASDFSFWLSVDPMADDYPWQSPYMYCSGNPINRVDPDGMNDVEVEMLTKKDGSVKINHMSDKGGNEVLIVNFSKENANGDHIKTKDPIAFNLANKNSNTSTITKKNNTNQASIATEIPTRIILTEFIKRAAIGTSVLTVSIFVPLIFTVSGDTRQRKDEFAQHGKNDGRLTEKELERILAKPEAQRTNEEKMKLKKHKKNIKERPSRQSKDIPKK